MSRRRLALVAILLVGIAYATMIQSFSWNQTSHYDLIRSLNVESTNIDAFQQNTGDKVFYRGHWYSARAPGLALFALPFYDTLKGLNAEKWARARQAMHGEDEMVYLIGLWGNVLPGLLLLLLVWRVAERFDPDTARPPPSRSASARWCCRCRRCCSHTSSPRFSASARSR